MDMYYILAANANGDIPGGRSFIWQCVTYLLETDIVVFVVVALAIIIFGWGIISLIKIAEDK